ncbi:MAG: TrbI/VirB10 family protein [Bilophila wadsworthia]|uniref:TrbI/VirB10 family protein n=1 Tax=Bilophila wadsworthia TaxID=35833 RepID=UPI0027BAC97F|nr:TrbI/VirB10 family protein [Bilophila wadsworthia]MDU4374449.1 TrbI/VirB10 family protein [Bilophila wadsworthia]
MAILQKLKSWLPQTDVAPDPLNAETVPNSKRLNRLPLLIFGAACSLVLGVFIYVGYQRSLPRERPQKTENPKASVSSQQFAEEIASKAKPGSFIATIPQQQVSNTQPEKTPGAEPGKEPQISTQQDSHNVDMPTVLVDPYLEDRLRIRERRFQALEAALRSKMGVQVSELRARSTTRNLNAEISQTRQRLAAMTDPSSTYQARLAQLRGESVSGADELYRSTGTGKNDVRRLERTDSWSLDSQVEAPASPYMIRAGFVIPAIMISGINSDLPGQVMAQVSQNVWDTATGRFLLIPQGTRLIGAYSSDVAYGQERVLMAWQRLIFPDGKTFDIRAMPGADSAGYAGFTDQINNHWFRTISSAILMSGVIAAVDLSQDDNNSSDSSDRQRAGDALSEALGQTLGQVLGQIISKNLNISPTLEIRPGYRFNVIAVKDMTLPGPYQAFNY